MRAEPPSTWSITTRPLGRVDVERLVGGVRVRLELLSGGGFCASTAVWRVAGRVVAVLEVGSG